MVGNFAEAGAGAPSLHCGQSISIWLAVAIGSVHVRAAGCALCLVRRRCRGLTITLRGKTTGAIVLFADQCRDLFERELQPPTVLPGAFQRLLLPLKQQIHFFNQMMVGAMRDHESMYAAVGGRASRWSRIREDTFGGLGNWVEAIELSNTVTLRPRLTT